MPITQRLQFFEKDPIEWSGNYEMHHFYKTLLTLHASHPALNGDQQLAPVQRLATSDVDRILAYKRISGDKEVVVFFFF